MEELLNAIAVGFIAAAIVSLVYLVLFVWLPWV